MPNDEQGNRGVNRKSGGGNLYGDNPYGGSTFLSAPDPYSPYGPYAGGYQFDGNLGQAPSGIAVNSAANPYGGNNSNNGNTSNNGGGGGGSWLGNILSAVTGGLFNVYGANKQADATDKAAQLQRQSFQEALQYEKERDSYLKALEAQRYADLTGRLQPWISTGQSATERMARLLGLG